MSNTLSTSCNRQNAESNKLTVKRLKDDFVIWIKKNWKALLIAGVSSIAAIIALILGMKHKDDLISLWNDLSDLIHESASSPTTIVDVDISTIYAIDSEVSSQTRIPLQKEVLVPPHLRTLPEGWHHSPEKAIEAAENGFSDLLPNQTWVRSYTKNAA